jgi:hypothetical protein
VETSEPTRDGTAEGDHDSARESLRLCERYVREVVLAFGLCPWAEPALRQGRVARRVFRGGDVEPDSVLPAIDALEATGVEPSLDIGLFLFPDHTGGWVAFDAFADRVRRADRARRCPGAAPAFFVAAFHPDGPEALPGPNRLTFFLRRSPDPMLQLVRSSTMDRLKSHQPNASETLAESTFAALDADGGARARALSEAVRAIERDRRRG